MESIHGNPPTRDLFSRGSSPPVQQAPMPYAAHPNPSSTQLDSLFQNLTSPQSDQSVSMNNFATPSTSSFATPSTIPAHYAGSGPGTPVMSMDGPRDSPASHHSGSMMTAERQSALLSLLNQPSGVNVHRTGGSTGSLPPPQQVSTPPEPFQRSGASPTHNEAQGKILLEQLMAGPTSRSIYPESQPGPLMSGPPSAPSPTYGHSPQQYDPDMLPSDYRHNNDMDYRSQYDPQPGMGVPQQVTPPLPPQTKQAAGQPLPPSPPKSMFDFVSPFDALQSATGSIRKKPMPTSSVPSSGNDDSSWTAISDPKRRSVENLLENLTLGSPAAPPPATFESFGGIPPQPDYGSMDPIDLPMNRYGPPPSMPQNLPPPPKAMPPRVDSPRASPPKNQAQRVSQAVPASSRRDKEGSPGPRGGGSLRGKKNKNQASPGSQSQNIVIDVSQSLEEIQTTRDLVKSTAIALVKQDSVFLPGTTIGATHWVAYAMTRGRVRVISRSSGDRTLLQLPPLFPQTTSVTDMAVYGNRLAGVTSDGGFVVWELPEVITDDVPGRLMLCVGPSPMSDALHSVKWHPKEPDVLAVASEHTVFLIDLVLSIADLNHYAQTFNPQSPVVAFDFDTIHYGIATISDDSTLTIWNINDRTPSSLLFVDGAIVVGRKNGTIFQLLNLTTKVVLSTIKFVNGAEDDREMFGHASYDTRIQTLWIANCRRDSFFGFKINFEPRDEATSGYFEQVVEFPGPKPTIHFVILTADSDPTGDEAHAACIAAKVPPGELALVAFSVHSTGVDQVLIRKEWYDNAFAQVPAKLPSLAGPAPLSYLQQANEPKSQRPFLSGPQNSGVRARTPPSEEVDADVAREEPRQEGRKGRGKNVNFKDKDENAPEKEKRGGKSSNNDSGNDSSSLGQALTKEIRKTEENLHTRISKLISKEMDKQHQRLEESRAHDQAEEMTRQEKILKLISQELSRNTTRVVEIAVKSEVQNSVLPALENITRNEVKAALNERVGRGMVEFMSQSLPGEIEKMITRPDMAQHFSNIISSALVPAIERHVKDSMSKTVPAFQQHNTALHQELLRELRTELHSVKTEMSAWQNEAFRNQESIKQLEHTVRALSEQMKFSNAGTPNSQHSHGPSQVAHSLSQPAPQARPNLPPAQAPPPPPPQMQNWYSSGIVAPQASHPLVPPPPVTQERMAPPPAMKSEQWDEIYLSTLHTQDLNKLRDLLARSDADVVMPPNGPVLVSQAVILTLIHRLAAALGETSPTEEAFKASLWWLQRAVAILRPEDKLISDFIPRVVPNVQQSLNTTKQRLSILPGGGTYEGARAISEVQEALRRKVVA
ncbi:hypothetical protein BD626DRAFT_498259 [Schizophyllum amplum]|uniref:Enhancer of mRNA-decapping protein 4 C-terminal domain-containing protein n=1 Tax=Schizophyllum amplum TaxID=97359 RepID=A0A550CD44_9AGAR|nr:hypothetical protein BD626DRAFT_498259 [Auriculariopsis ampla]